MAAKRPTDGVKKLKVERDGLQYRATWDYTKKSKSGDRAYSKVFCQWRLIPQSGASPIDRNKQKGTSDRADTENLGNFTATKPKGKHYTRASFYPSTSQRLMAVEATVWGENGAGSSPKVGSLYVFKEPARPTVSWAYNQQNGTVTATVKSDQGDGQAERYDTVARIEVKLGDGSKSQLRANTSVGSATTWNSTAYQVSNYQADFSLGETLVFTCTAYSRGFRGDSESATSTITVGAPNAATITGVTAESKEQSGRIRVGVNVGARTSSVQLQRRHGESGSWENVDGAVDDGKCRALYDSVGMAEPSDGENLYYRVVSSFLNFTTTSEPFLAEALFTALPTAGSVSVGIVSLTAADNGEGAVAVIGWDEDEQEADGVEVTWSEDPNAWESTKQPDSFDATWRDAVSQSQDWDNTLKVYILDLEQGATYYVRARAYVETDEGRSYTGYTAFETVSPVTRPSSVVLDAPPFVARGEAIPLTWTFDGESEQTEWHVFSEDNPHSPLDEGQDAMGYASVTADLYGDAQALSLYVLVGAGGATTQSNTVTVGITDYPQCWVDAPATVTGKPSAFDLYSTSSDSRAVVRCVSHGIGAHGPLGGDSQHAGDTVWAANVRPAWEEVVDPETVELYGEGVFHAEVPVPVEARLVDTATYDLAAYVVDETTGLQSEVSEDSFEVEWEHQAVDPPTGIVVVADSEGRSVRIELSAPDGAAETDVYDVYRGSASGYELVATDQPLDGSVVDNYATFGESSYRICLRTADGDQAWADYPYVLSVPVTRFDWDGDSLEVRWGLDFSDSYKKSFSAREHMDGSTGGSFNPPVARGGTYSARVLKNVDEGVVDALLAMCGHPGAVYCRRPDGHAFQCNVDVDTSDRPRSLVMSPSFTVSRVSLTDEFMVEADYTEE